RSSKFQYSTLLPQSIYYKKVFFYIMEYSILNFIYFCYVVVPTILNVYYINNIISYSIMIFPYEEYIIFHFYLNNQPFYTLIVQYSIQFSLLILLNLYLTTSISLIGTVFAFTIIKIRNFFLII